MAIILFNSYFLWTLTLCKNTKPEGKQNEDHAESIWQKQAHYHIFTFHRENDIIYLQDFYEDYMRSVLLT